MSPPDTRRLACVAAEEAYWNQHSGILWAPVLHRLFRLLTSAGRSRLLTFTEEASCRYYGAGSLKEAQAAHHGFRLRCLGSGARGELSELHVAIGEFIIDYLLYQWAFRSDLRRVSRLTAFGETTATALVAGMVERRSMRHKVCMYLQHSTNIFDALPPAVLSGSDWSGYAEYAETRVRHHGTLFMHSLRGLERQDWNAPLCDCTKKADMNGSS